MTPAATWIVLAWRLPSGSSTPRVTIWRSLKRLGAATLTPGAALLPFREDLLEQLGWLAQEVEELGGDAWVLPVAELSEREEFRVREQVNGERDIEYKVLAREAAGLLTGRTGTGPSRRELNALRQRLDRIRSRDHYGAPGRLEAIGVVEASCASEPSMHPVRVVALAAD